MLGLDLVLRDAGLLAIDKGTQSYPVTGLAIYLELLDKNSRDIRFPQPVALRQRLAAIPITAHLQHEAITAAFRRLSGRFLFRLGNGSGFRFRCRIQCQSRSRFIGNRIPLYLVVTADFIDKALFQLGNRVYSRIQLDNFRIKFRI